MEKRRIGDRLQVSLIGLGCNNLGTRLDAEAGIRVVQAALEEGVNHFDTAATYGDGRSEEILGRALAGRRDEAVIATKAAPRPRDLPYRSGVLAQSIRDNCEASLRRLSTDRIDLYYQHFPDPQAPLEEALEALEALVEAGKVVASACSNYDPEQMRRAGEFATARGSAGLVANQIEWNLIKRATGDQVAPLARELGMSIVPYFPLAAGVLTGKYRAGEPIPSGSRATKAPYVADLLTEQNLAYVDALEGFARNRGHTALELALAWLCAQPEVASVIAGAMSPEQLRANLAASSWRLSSEDLRAMPVLT